jgi:hypothetical protein
MSDFLFIGAGAERDARLQVELENAGCGLLPNDNPSVRAAFSRG